MFGLLVVQVELHLAHQSFTTHEKLIVAHPMGAPRAQTVIRVDKIHKSGIILGIAEVDTTAQVVDQQAVLTMLQDVVLGDKNDPIALLIRHSDVQHMSALTIAIIVVFENLGTRNGGLQVFLETVVNLKSAALVSDLSTLFKSRHLILRFGIIHFFVILPTFVLLLLVKKYKGMRGIMHLRT